MHLCGWSGKKDCVYDRRTYQYAGPDQENAGRYLINNAKKAINRSTGATQCRCEQIKSQVSEIKVQVKSTAKNIVDETKAKGRAALYRVTEFVGIKRRLLNVRTAVKDMIVSTDRDIARIALLAKGLREAGQIVNNVVPIPCSISRR